MGESTCMGVSWECDALRNDASTLLLVAARGFEHMNFGIFPLDPVFFARIRNCFSPPGTISSAWTRER